MASASIRLQRLLCILLPCSVVVAFSSQRCYSHYFVTEYRGRPTNRDRSNALALGADTESNPTRSNLRDRWILLVEDDDDLRSATGKMLANEGGFSVTGVSDARSALLVCRGIVRPDFSSTRARFKFDPKFIQHANATIEISTNNSTQHVDSPDCLVLDIRLAGSMDGLELLKIIRSDPLLESLPVVLLTAKGKVEDRVQGYEAGADAYLPKPFDPEELLSIVNGLLTRDKLSGGGSTAINDNGGSEVYAELKRELAEIKALMNELDNPPSTPQTGDPITSVNSIQSDIFNMKEVIKRNVNQMENNSIAPPRTTNNELDQFNTLTVLTPEETEVIGFVANGMTNKEIAAEMQCSISKIEKLMSSMFKKAAVKRRADLVDWWAHAKTDAKSQSEPAQPDKISSSLTADESKVVTLLEQGMTTEEIVSKTQSSKRKIDKLLHTLFNKTKTKNRTELVRWWRANGNA